MLAAVRRASGAALRGARGRGLAAAAAAAEKQKERVTLPVQLFGLHARYANALFVAGSRANALGAVEKDLGAMEGWLTQPASLFGKYLANPVISRADKMKDMEKLSKGMGDTTRGFLSVLAENGRLAELPKVMDTFQVLLNAQRGIVEATVTTAEELPSKQAKAIEKAISSGYLESGQKLNLVAKVDPSVIGGLQVQIGNQFLDLSIQSEINKIYNVLK